MSGKGRVAPEVMEERLAETARLLVRRRSMFEVERELARKYSVHTRTTRKWIRRVREQWRAEADVETAVDARADLIQQLDAVLGIAWNNVEIVCDDNGNAVLDGAEFLPDGKRNPGFGKPLVRNAPKVQHVLHAVSQLRALRGADKPEHKIVTLDGDLNVMPDVGALPDAVAEKLRKELEALTPGGDLRQIAGEWFRQTEGVEAKK